MSELQTVETFDQSGYEVVRVTRGPLQVDILPGKGGDILAMRWLPLDLNLLWTSPRGLRAAGPGSAAAGSVESFMESYPGGWQMIFPNGGDATSWEGVDQPFHGEACRVPWEWRPTGPHAVELETRLTQTPFRLLRRLHLDGRGLEVIETVTNEGDVPLDAMWSHHPALGPPFLSGSCIVETAARAFMADDARDTEASDLEPGSRWPWPMARSRAGAEVDLGRVPGEDEHVDRFGYLVDLERGWAAVTNPELELRVELTWARDVMPYAWFWLEAHATQGFPWHGEAYVLAIEPASSYPGQGLEQVAAKTATQLRFEPGESRTARLRMDVSRRPAPSP